MSNRSNWPTKEDLFTRILDGKAHKSTAWTEDYAEAFLKAIDAPQVHKVDGNSLYTHRASNLCTPDFILGKDKISDGNNPTDFYVDVQEITGGPWDVKKKSNPFFSEGSPVRKMWEYGKLHKPTEENPVRIPLIETNPDVLKAIFNPLRKKSAKYGLKKRNSARFGLISVQAPSNNFDETLHLKTLQATVFKSITRKIKQGGAEWKYIEQMEAMFFLVLLDRIKGLFPIAAPFIEDTWCFWAIISTTSGEGNCTFIINTTGLKKAKSLQKDAVTRWVEKISVRKTFSYIEKLRGYRQPN